MTCSWQCRLLFDITALCYPTFTSTSRLQSESFLHKIHWWFQHQLQSSWQLKSCSFERSILNCDKLNNNCILQEDLLACKNFDFFKSHKSGCTLEATHFTNFDVLLTVHFSIFISVFNQLHAQNLFHNKFYFIPLHVSSTCAHHQEVKIALHSLWYHHTYRWPSRPPVGLYYVCIACSDFNILLVLRSFNTFRSTVLYVVSLPLSVWWIHTPMLQFVQCTVTVFIIRLYTNKITFKFT